MSTGPGAVLRNAALAQQVTKLTSHDRMRAADTAGQAPTQAPAPVEVGAPAQERHDEAYRRGYEQGLDEGAQRVTEAMLAAEIESARQTGQKQGFEAGLRAAQEAAVASVSQVLSTFERLLAAIPHQLQGRMAALEEDMVALGFEALVRLLGETAASPEGLRMFLRQALAEFGPRQLLEVRVHPDDLKCLLDDAVAGTWLRQREGGEHARFIADAGVELGGVVLRSPAGTLDARLEMQLQGLRRALVAARAARSPARGATV